MTPARPRRHAAARGAAALAVLVVALAARVAPTVADTPTNDPTSTTSTTTGGAGTASTPSITLVSQSAWVGPTGVFEMRVRGPLPVSGQIDARVYVPISTQDQLATTSAGDQLGALVEHVAVPAAQVVRAADGSFLLRYPLVTGGSVPTYGLHLSNPGVYPFELRIEDIDGTVVGDLVTQLIRLPDEQSGIPALSVALVVPYGAPVSRSPDSSPHLTPSTLAALRAESVALARAPGVPVAVAPVPETIDTLAQIDRTSGTHGVAQLATAIRGRTLVSGTYVTVDSGAWLADGLADGYERQLAVGRAVLDAGLQSSPSRTVSTTDATTTPDVLAVAFDHGTREVVVSSSRLAEDGPGTGTPSGPLTQWFDLASSNGERIQAVPADAKLDAQLVEGPDQVLSAHHVLAALALVALDRSDPQACVRPSGEACRRGVGIQLP
ncbi:MAG TPA: hypothetical protein VMT43_14085, partial [Acidimicrobiales bacterium]|nr:hypothetical protein [Acidimicrobiales bacterium]